MEMSTGPKGVDPTHPVELVIRERRNQQEQSTVLKGDQDQDTDTVVEISSRAALLHAAMPADEIDTERWIEEYDVDSRRTAEAIMKRVVPDLYKALADAGEVEK